MRLDLAGAAVMRRIMFVGCLVLLVGPVYAGGGLRPDIIFEGGAFEPPGPASVNDGLRVWLRASTGVDVLDDQGVAMWRDASGNDNHAMHNPQNLFAEQEPVFDAVNPLINGQAAVSFVGNNALELDLSWLANSDYTVFVIAARDRFDNANFYLAGEGIVQNTNLILGYERVDLIRQSHYINDLDGAVEEYVGAPLVSLDTFRFEAATGRIIYRNGVPVVSDDSTAPLTENLGTTLGHFRPFGELFWFEGFIAEVIVYDRALGEVERANIENRLLNRYGLQPPAG